jgi:hypothetical protein
VIVGVALNEKVLWALLRNQSDRVMMWVEHLQEKLIVDTEGRLKATGLQDNVIRKEHLNWVWSGQRIT